MHRRVTPPKRVTSPTWGPPPLCKQALNTIETCDCSSAQSIPLADPEKGPAPPWFVDQNEARRAEKNFLGDHHPSLSQGLYDRPSPPPPWIRHSTLGVFIREVVSGPTLDNRIQAIFNIQPIKIFFNKSVLKQDQRHTFTPIRKTRSHLSDQYHEVCLSNPNHVIKILFRFLYRLQKCQHEEPHAVKILSRNLIS